MRYRLRTLLILLLGMFLVVGILWGIDTYEHALVAPPPGVHSLSDFRKFIDKPRALVRVQRANSDSFVLFGKQQGWRLREWPPGYAFDARGRLQVWAVEASDVQEHNARLWEPARNEIREGRLLSYDQALEMIAELADSHQTALPLP